MLLFILLFLLLLCLLPLSRAPEAQQFRSTNFPVVNRIERVMMSFVYSCKLSAAILRCSWFFLLRRLTLFIRFTFVHTAKLKKSNFLNDFFLSLTAFARVTSFLTRFSESF